ncbi:Tripartite-type tricarboxylate transporter, receptor component TctC [Lentibacillus halodurans]|uniref:Tripartite-type tricarboxylate transporter, receptor component TctC n=1 Tax=Lentibacillus halodurans TaxID=237679 RepID=A0A1I1AJV5_9BACI|nr:tripartite tricarboxylate transporter substrate binding protein [Lentibacillus halodurans]SFB37772.1 Tripartite-type tricarboxylate transporter, receptor component TctC [Lentibacillus halodurans]
MRKFMYMSLFTAVILVLLSACNQASNESASAESWPEDPITMVVPTGEGGSNDRQARAVAPYLEEYLGVPVTVENRPGAATIQGTTSYLNEEDDGSFLFYPLQYHFSGGIARGGEYSVDDFAVAGVTHQAPIALWVHADSPYQTAEDLIAALQEDAENMSFGFQPGSASHVAGLVMQEVLGLEFREVPYDGGGDQRAALLGGNIDFMTTDFEGTLAAVGEDARPLLLFADQPHPLDESVPLAKDVLQEFTDEEFVGTVQNFRFLAAHASFKENYPERFETLRTALEDVYADEEFQQWVSESEFEMELLDIEPSTEMVQQADEVIKSYGDQLIE